MPIIEIGVCIAVVCWIILDNMSDESAINALSLNVTNGDKEAAKELLNLEKKTPENETEAERE